MMARPGSAANRAANIWTARIIPILLLAIYGYVSWVVTKVECIDYLLRPSASSGLRARPAPAIAILTIYYVLLFLDIVSYARLVSAVLTNPGLVPRGPQWYIEHAQKNKKSHKRSHLSEKADFDETDSGEGMSAKGTLADAESFRVQDFWLKDVFVCQYDGRPKFCSQCYNYKTDRVHHCSELDRCVYKMDHFCPWVGGVVSETSYKFFIQFTFWTGLFCIFNLIHVAYFFAERQRHFSGVNVHWIIVVAFAGLFTFFGVGMCASSLQFAIENTGTIENLGRRSHVWYLAVYVPFSTFERLTPAQRDSLRWISYPRPQAEQIHLLEDSGADHIAPTTDAAPMQTQSADTNINPQSQPQPQPQRTFAILESDPGANPFDLGALENFKQIMGNNLFDWLLPIKHSPCHLERARLPQSMYRMGRVVYKMKKHAGIAEEGDRQRYAGPKKNKARKRRRKADSAAHHNEWHGSREGESTSENTSRGSV